jgi:hypothetical protein
MFDPDHLSLQSIDRSIYYYPKHAYLNSSRYPQARTLDGVRILWSLPPPADL